MIFDRNDIKVSFDRPKYVTEGNKVTCTLNYRVNVPGFRHDEAKMTVKGYNPKAVQAYGDFDLGDMHTATCVAVCSPTDEFSKKTGREIAEARAEAKAYKHAAILVKKFVKTVADAYASMSLEFEAKADYVQRHNKEYVAETGK
jgi:hypothetical protein